MYKKRPVALLYSPGFSAARCDVKEMRADSLLLLIELKSKHLPKYCRENIEIIRGSKKINETCIPNARKLFHYFNEKGITKMTRNLQEHNLYISAASNRVVGFIAVKSRSSQVSEISWMEVKP